MDLQKHNQGLIQLPDTILVKVPQPLYQIWCDIVIGMARSSTSERQKRIFKELTDWVTRKYPAYGIVAFQDYSSREALALSKQTGQFITWGMYVLLQVGGSMQPYSITTLLEEGTKAIEGGQ